MRKQQSSSRARERRLRAQYRRNIKIAIALSLILGLAIGMLLGRATAPKAARPSSTALPSAITPTPEVTPQSDLSLSLATETPEPTAVPTPTPTPAPTATPEPQVVVVPFGSVQQLTAQVNADGTSRRTADASASYEELSFSLQVTRYLTPEYYQTYYSTQYQMQGDEAGVEFELTLNDYMGSQTITPQELFSISLETASGVSEQGFQLTDAEIHGENKVTITTNIPKMFYKRFKFSNTVGDMTYLAVTTYVDGQPRKYLFELGEPVRPVEPTPSPTPEVVYSTLEVGSRGDDVVKLQTALIEQGYLTGTADGRYGEQTSVAVKAAQTAFGLPATGSADNALQQKLYAAN